MARPLTPRELLVALFAASLALSFVAVGFALVAGAVFAEPDAASPSTLAWAGGVGVLAALQYVASRVIRRYPRSRFVIAVLAVTAAVAVAMLAVEPLGILPWATLVVVAGVTWVWRAQARAAGG
jgi:peptidoglycan/LPS O-acetylase OafA/YrhL